MTLVTVREAGAVTARRFPPPWSVEELDACFVVRDANGQALSYVYFEDEPGRRSVAKLWVGRNKQSIGLTYQVTAGPLGLIWRVL